MNFVVGEVVVLKTDWKSGAVCSLNKVKEINGTQLILENDFAYGGNVIDIKGKSVDVFSGLSYTLLKLRDIDQKLIKWG